MRTGTELRANEIKTGQPCCTFIALLAGALGCLVLVGAGRTVRHVVTAALTVVAGLTLERVGAALSSRAVVA